MSGATLLGMGVVAPGALGCAALWETLAAGPGPSQVETVGREEAVDVKRLPRLDRMVLAAAKEALGNSAAPSALVFATGNGGLAATVDFLEGMCTRGAAFGSPSAFHESVHNAPAGQLSIRLGITGPCLTATARELSGESALAMGLDLLHRGHRRVLVVAADELVPTYVHAYQAFVPEPGPDPTLPRPAEGAAAVLLGEEPGPLRLERVVLGAHPRPTLRFADGGLAPLLARALEGLAPPSTVSLAVCDGPARTAESEALIQLLPNANRVDDGPRFGFNPSGGLLRLVAAAQRLQHAGRPGAALVHGLALGGGQAAAVLSHGS